MTDSLQITLPVQNHRQVRLDKLQQITAMGIDAYPYRFEVTHYAHAIAEKYRELATGETSGDTVRVAGRIMSIRNSGMFIDLLDTTGKVQVFSHKDHLAADDMQLLELLDLGDLIGVEGIVRRTPRGELTVNVSSLTLLAKALLPPPEKFHGLTDVDTRYRQRYIDLIANEQTRETLRQRSRIVASLRQFLIERGYLEVETPMLHPIPGGTNATPFTTHHKALDVELYLRIAPELYLKRLIVGGLTDRVFEINRNFRNEGLSTRHNPEFTMLELYQAHADYNDMMELTETMVAEAAQALLGTTVVQYGDRSIDFKTPWRRATMCDLVREAAGIDFMALASAEEARHAAKGAGVHMKGDESWGKAVEAVFGEKVEHTLIQPTHVTDMPKDISPLAKVHRGNPRLAERFEVYANGFELANAFSELNDPQDQLARFQEQVANREKGDDEAQYLDSDYVTALEYGMAPHGRHGVGHRPAGDAADQQRLDPGCDRLPDDAAQSGVTQMGTGMKPSLNRSALGFAESVVMGVAGTAPAFSIAATMGTLIAAVGVLSPASLLYCGIIMFGTAFAFLHLGRRKPDAGAAFAWVGQAFHPALGFFAGWALLVASAAFMVSGTVPAATATLTLVAPGLVQNTVAVTMVAALWLLAISAVVLKGIKASSYFQVVMTAIELVVVLGLTIAAWTVPASPDAPPLTLPVLLGQGFTPALFASGALVSLFFYWGWDVTANLQEETRDPGRNAGRAACLAMLIVLALFVAFAAACLRLLSPAEIQDAGTNIVFVIARKIVPGPLGYAAVLAVMLSTIGTIETTILQFTRTLFAMARAGALPPCYARLHARFHTPWVATGAITVAGLVLLLLSTALPGVNTVVRDSVNAIGFQVAFYYSLTCAASAWTLRREWRQPTLLVTGVVWPLLSSVCLVAVAALSVPTFDLATLVVGFGGVAAGVVPLFVNRSWSR